MCLVYLSQSMNASTQTWQLHYSGCVEVDETNRAILRLRYMRNNARAGTPSLKRKQFEVPEETDDPNPVRSVGQQSSIRKV
jgi:hypothetical protein